MEASESRVSEIREKDPDQADSKQMDVANKGPGMRGQVRIHHPR